MATNNRNTNTRAKKTNVYGDAGSTTKTTSSKSAAKAVKKIKKSPIAVLLIIFLIAGAVVGFVVANQTTYFTFNAYTVDGVASDEADYVVIDLTEKKLEFEETLGRALTVQEVADSIKIEDGGIEICFLGKFVADTVLSKIYYREDLSHDECEVSEIDLTVAGTYYVEYVSSHFAFKNTKLIRTIFVTGVEENG